MKEERVTFIERLVERLGRSPRLIALVGLFAWLALLWFMLRDVL